MITLSNGGIHEAGSSRDPGFAASADAADRQSVLRARPRRSEPNPCPGRAGRCSAPILGLPLLATRRAHRRSRDIHPIYLTALDSGYVGAPGIRLAVRPGCT